MPPAASSSLPGENRLAAGSAARRRFGERRRPELGTADEDERARPSRSGVQLVRDGLLAGSGRADEEQRIRSRGFAGHGVPQRPDGGAVAEKRAFDAAAGVVQECLCDAQLALELGGPFRDARLERFIGGLELLGGAAALLVQLGVADRAGDLVRDDQDEPAVVRVERLRHGALDREHADQLVPDQQRDRDLALGIGEPGNGHGVAELGAAAGLDHLPALRRRIRPLLPQVVDVQQAALLGDHADDAGADPHATANRLVLVPAARDHAQHLAARLDEQDDRMVELEQLVHRPQRDVADLVQLERRVDGGRDALQDLELRGLPLDRPCEIVPAGRRRGHGIRRGRRAAYGNCSAEITR